jgi:hypothetical protein
LNNFSSTSAIVLALMSPLVTALALTCESKAKPVLYALAKELTPTDGVYHDTLQDVATKDLVPWLGTIDTLLFLCLATSLTRHVQTFTFPPSTRVLPSPILSSKWRDILLLISSIAVRLQNRSSLSFSTRRLPLATHRDRTCWHMSNTASSLITVTMSFVVQRSAVLFSLMKSGSFTHSGRRCEGSDLHGLHPVGSQLELSIESFTDLGPSHLISPSGLSLFISSQLYIPASLIALLFTPEPYCNQYFTLVVFFSIFGVFGAFDVFEVTCHRTKLPQPCLSKMRRPSNRLR